MSGKERRPHDDGPIFSFLKPATRIISPRQQQPTRRVASALNQNGAVGRWPLAVGRWNELFIRDLFEIFPETFCF